MHSRTRPLIPPRLAADLRANRIKLDIPHRQPEMRLVQRARIESPLPEMSAALVKPVDVLRVAEVRSAYGLGQRILGLWYRYNMDVIAHEAIADDVQAVLPGLIAEQLQIYMPIIIDKEYILTIISPLRDMSKTPGGDEHTQPQLSLLISA